MKRAVVAALALSLVALAHPRASAAPLVLSKDASGPITAASLSLELHPGASDATQTLIPDGSKLVADHFTMVVDDHGVGTFAGEVHIVGSDGHVILTGRLHGVAGLTSRRDTGKADALPGHLEGVIDGPDAAIQIYPPPPAIGQISFTANANTESASALPLYNAHLDGVVNAVAPPPATAHVFIRADKGTYRFDEPVLAITTNASDHAIVVYDERSYCSIVQLQQKTGDAWTQVAPCLVGRASSPTVIKAGQTLRVLLPADPATSAKKDGGSYRLALTFHTADSSGNPTGDESTVLSPIFTVTAPPPPPPTGKVTLTADKTAYAQTDHILATLSNMADTGIVAYDHQSFCTIVTLQRQVNGGWQALAPCHSLTPTRPVLIHAGSAVGISLPDKDAAAHFDAGVYRLQVNYTFADADGHPIPPIVELHSDSFKIGATTTPQGKASEE